MQTVNDSPTQRTYDSLNKAYNFFNERLFSEELPSCLITMQRKNKAYGYFAGDRFGTRDETQKADEIALNPSHFKARTIEEILSTLVHEMVHLWQHHYGQTSRSTYHNKQWAEHMRSVGLIPSNTGEPGGKETGQQMTHYIEVKGKFAIACKELIKSGFDLAYVDIWEESNAGSKKKKTANKTKYTCPGCDVNAWAKPGMRLICGDCQMELEAEETEEAESED